MLFTLSPYTFPNWKMAVKNRDAVETTLMMMTMCPCVCLFYSWSLGRWNSYDSDSFYDVRRSINTFVCACNGDRQTDRQTDGHTHDEIATGSCYASTIIRDVTTRWCHGVDFVRCSRPVMLIAGFAGLLLNCSIQGGSKKVSCCNVMDISKARQ